MKLERRQKVNRRRQIDPTTCERDYTDDEVEFMNALDDYKRKSGRMFPTCSEVLEVVRSLGYVRLSPNELAARTTRSSAGDAVASVAIEEERRSLGERLAIVDLPHRQHEFSPPWVVTTATRKEGGSDISRDRL